MLPKCENACKIVILSLMNVAGSDWQPGNSPVCPPFIAHYYGSWCNIVDDQWQKGTCPPVGNRNEEAIT